MKNLSLITVAITLSFSVQSVTLAQIFEDVLFEPESVQQVADIALLGDSNVVIELLDGEEIVHKFSLAGPDVQVASGAGFIFKVDDLNSPTVGGLVGGEEVSFAGDLQLITMPLDPETSPISHTRVTALNALVEIRTETAVETLEWEPIVAPKREDLPLNQRAEYIREIQEKVRIRRGQ
ncbi:MAG: hypothetical protein F4100_04770 [Rhodothermaceae bacterium]|nr:hypothetical protein [Rhodothermaceae bacterium]MYE62143.1 hypothetical protein [Rhodothermaceae bacterium]MYJ20043.1 hypothetical protein [Rhodothermaceae bacterium]